MFDAASSSAHNKTYLHRTAFLLESLKDLDEQLREKGSRLFVARGKPEDVLPGLFEKWDVTKLTFEADFEPRSLQRDREVSCIRFWSPRGRSVGTLAESKTQISTATPIASLFVSS